MDLPHPFIKHLNDSLLPFYQGEATLAIEHTHTAQPLAEAFGLSQVSFGIGDRIAFWAS